VDHSSRERDGRAWVRESSRAPLGSTVKPTLYDTAPMTGRWPRGSRLTHMLANPRHSWCQTAAAD